MNETTRKRALRATAKVALSSTVLACGAFTALGCGGSVEVPTGGPADPEGPSDTPVADGGSIGAKADATSQFSQGPGGGSQGPGGGATTGDEAACQAPLPEVDEHGSLVIIEQDADQLACCTEVLASDMPPVDWDDYEGWILATQTDDIQGCCNVILAHGFAPEIDWETTQACCSSMGNPFSAACTPWGPPVPPALLGDLPELVA